MKVDTVVQNVEELLMANESQNKKIKFLELEKRKVQAYVKDLQESLRLNKESISTLASAMKEKAVLKLNEENKMITEQTQKYYEDYLNVTALLLIEQQLRIEEKKMYGERLLEYENNMSQLRKYLQDKEESFTVIVTRLKKYQDLSEISMSTKLDRYRKDIQESALPDILRSLTEERDKYKEIWEGVKININELAFLKMCLEDEKSYQSMIECYKKFKELQPKIEERKDEKMMSFSEGTRNTSATYASHNNIQTNLQPNKQLIKLLKKQKLNNEILTQALNEAIEKNQEIITENNLLVEAHFNYEKRIQKLETNIFVLEQMLHRYDRSFALNSRKRPKCDLDEKQYEYKFNKSKDQSPFHIETLKEDVENLSSFIMYCVPKGKLIKSSSVPHLSQPETIEERLNLEAEEDIEFEEI